MDCPSCHAATRVLDTRPTGDAVRRRRLCVDCGERFTTHERPDPGADDVERAVVAYIRDLNRTEEVAAA